MNSRLTRSTLRLIAISLACIALQAIGATQSAAAFDCADYPPTFVRDIEVGGKVAAGGLYKLANGEIEAKVSVLAKKLLADHPDANPSQVMISLLAYNCRALQKEDLSPKERLDARERFNTIVIQALYPSSHPQVVRLNTSKTDIAAGKVNTKIERSVPPSARLAARKMLLAAERFKSALSSTYSAVLGGSYLPVLPYDLMQDKFMLASAAHQNMMQSIPNVKVYPEDANTSLGFDICMDINAARKVIDKVLAIYGSKIPEVFYQDIEKIEATVFYSYFSSFIESGGCDVFQGEIKNALSKRDPRHVNDLFAPYSIPAKLPTFVESDLAEYIATVKSLEEHAKTIGNAKASLMLN